MDTVYETKGIDESQMSDEEYDEFLKSSDPKLYEEIQQELKEFKTEIEKIAAESGVKIVSKKDLDKYPGQYGISLKAEKFICFVCLNEV